MTDAPARKSRLIRNVGYGVLSWLLPIVPTLLVIPYVLEKLGKDQYGVLGVLLGFISYFFTASIGRVGAKYVSEFLSSGRDEEVSGVISATFIVSSAAAFLSTIVAAAAAGPIVDEVLRIPSEFRDDAVVGVYLASATVLTTASAQTFILLLQGVHRFDRYFLLANFTSISFSIGSLIAAWLGFGFVYILAWNLATWVLAGFVAFVFVKQALPDFSLTLRIPAEIWRLVGRYAAGIVGYQLFGNVLLLFERGWIVRRFGPEALTFYMVPMTLAMYIHAFTASLVTSTFPTVNELLGAPDKLRALYQNCTKIVLWILTLAVFTVLVCGRPFLAVWLRQPSGQGISFADASAVLLIVHTITFSMLALNTIAWHVAEAFRAASINAYATLLWMLIGITAMLLLGPRWGIDGVGVGRLLGVLPFLPMILYVESKFLGGVQWSFWLGSVTRLTGCALLAGGAQLFVIKALGTSWFSVAAAGGIGLLVYAASTLVAGFVSSADRRMVLAYLKQSIEKEAADG